MSMATRADTQSPALHVGDSHGLIRVLGARVNNLKDISVEIPKRRLTVFTGVSGSGKSSLVFGTIAAESQRLINETYSAFVQGFMPTLARPEVDVLDGLTTAINVDQQRIGADPRSTVGTATDANPMLRILFSRLGQPRIGSPNAFSFNVASVRASGAITVERGDRKTVRQTFTRTGGMCPRCEGLGTVSDVDLTQLFDDSKSLADGAIIIPGYTVDNFFAVRPYLESGILDPDKPICKYTKKELHDFLHREPSKVKVNGVNVTYEGLIPKITDRSWPRTGRRCSRISAPSWTGLSRSPPAPSAAAPGSARRRGRRGSARSTSPMPARCRSATWPNGSGTSTSRRWRRCWPHWSGPSTRSWKSGWATSRLTGRRARCRAARRSG